MVVAVTPATQGMLLTLTGAVLLRITVVDDVYLNYVNPWMRWPLVACGLLLLGLALSQLGLLDSTDDDQAAESDGGRLTPASDATVPRAAWLLFLPSVLIFVVAPPALGAHLAERGVEPAAPATAELESSLTPLPATDPAPVTVTEFFVRARYDSGLTLADRSIEMTGFVSYDEDGAWYVTRFGINCCAADALATKVRASGYDAPPRDQWVSVVGTWIPGTIKTPAVEITDLELTEPPKVQYE